MLLGNKDFHSFLANTNDQYHHPKISKSDMERIRSELIRSVALKGGRFMHVNKEGGWWEEISDMDSVHFKINNAFYDYNRKQKAIRNQQSAGCATSEFIESSKRRKLSDDMGCIQSLFNKVQPSLFQNSIS